MSIRLKLILTYVLMIIGTVTILAVLITAMVAGAITKLGEMKIQDMTVQQAVIKGLDVMVDLRYAERHDPESLETAAFAQTIATELKAFKGFLVVRNAKQFSAYGNDMADVTLFNLIQNDVDLTTQDGVDADDTSSTTTRDPMNAHNNIKWNNREYVVNEYGFPELDENTLSYYVLIDTTDMKTTSTKYNNRGIFFLFILVCILIGPLVWITTKDIVNPLKKLEVASQKISQGNLDFELTSKKNNEVGRVIRGYEKMRQELKKSIDQQISLEENRKELVSSISHDLKTPITSIKGYVEGIRDGVADNPEKLNKYLDVIYAKSLDMDRMINDLFLFSKLDLRKEVFDMERVNVKSFYEHCTEEIHLEYDKTGIVITTENQVNENTYVKMDSQKIKRVILNIVNNAVKYMDKEQKIMSILFSQTDTEWLLSVTDNGPGMTPEELERIFDRFYRTDPSRNTKTGGSGLGLAIAKHIIDQHGGAIGAKSDKGVFTTVRFRIPIDFMS